MAAPVYEVQGRRVEMPVEVRHARSGAATYAVSARAAQRLLPGDEFRVAEIAPGRTLLSIAAIDYVDTPENIRANYQYFTEADVTRLRAAGYDRPFTALEDGVARYITEFLATNDPYR